MKKTISILIVAVILSALGGGISAILQSPVYAKKAKNAKQFKIKSQETIRSISTLEATAEGISIKSTIDADIDVATNQVDLATFKKKFAAGQPAKAVCTLADNIVYYYEIIGSEGNSTIVKSKFLKNPNPAWVGKEMIGKYDKTKDFDEAVTDMSKCSGPLYDLMMGK